MGEQSGEGGNRPVRQEGDEIEPQPTDTRSEQLETQDSSTEPVRNQDTSEIDERGPRTVESRPVSSARGEQEIGGVTVFDGEELHHDIQPPWTAYWWDLLVGSVLALTMVGLVIAPYWFYKAYKKRKNTRYIITSDRIILQKGGVTRTSSEEYQFQNMDTISTSQGFVEGIFGKGSVEMTLREEFRDDKEIELSGIHDYEDVKTTIRREQYNEMNS